MVGRDIVFFVAAVAATGCIDFVGAYDGECSQEGFCSGNLACVENRCVLPAVACEGKCGMVGGAECGGCNNSDEVCSSSNVCRVPCVRFSCGMDLGVDCGSCPNDSECNNRQCEQICPGRCGMVLGQDCGGCSSAALCLDTRCEPVFDCSTPPAIVQSEEQWWVDVGAGPDFEPLCSGWVVMANDSNQISVVNAVNPQMTGPSWQFQGRAKALLLRFSERAIYAVVGPPYEFVRLNILDGSQQSVSLDVTTDDFLQFFDDDPKLLLLANNRVRGGRLFTLQASPPAVLTEQPLPLFLNHAELVPGERLLFALSSTAAHRFALTELGAVVEEEQLLGRFRGLAVAPNARRLVLSLQPQHEPLMEVGFDDLHTMLGAYRSTNGVWHNNPRYHPSETFVVGVSESDHVIYQWDTVNRVNYRQGSRIGGIEFSYGRLKWAPGGAHAYALSNGRLFFLPTPRP